MKILVIEDDRLIASVLRVGLKGARYLVDVAADGCTGLQMALEGQYELILLDVMLPEMDGWTVCRTLRERGNTTPILMLTALDSADHRIDGLELGADDYLPKPFHFPELLARVRHLVRRDQVHRARWIRVADLEIDTTTGRVSRGDRELRLTQKELALLEELATNEGRVLSCHSLGERLQQDGFGTEEGIHSTILTLSRKLDDWHSLRLISAAGSVGYVLRAPEAALAAA